jgi:hypothetical protein
MTPDARGTVSRPKHLVKGKWGGLSVKGIAGHGIGEVNQNLRRERSHPSGYHAPHPDGETHLTMLCGLARGVLVQMIA